MNAPSERAWCYYRNLVQAVYREVRHAGARGDQMAKLFVDDDHYRSQMANILTWRAFLKDLTFYFQIEHISSTPKIRRPYEDATGLTLDDLAALFGRPGWARSYGGERWQIITRAAIDLGDALDRGDGPAAEHLCDQVRELRHNSDWLVPRDPSQHNKEKWPRLYEEST